MGAHVTDPRGQIVRLEHEVERRTRVERRMQQLLELTGELAAARTRDEIVALALDKGRTVVGAVGLALWLRDGDELELLATSSRFGTVDEAFHRLSLATPVPLTQAVRTGEPVFLGSPEECRARFPASYERAVAMLPFPVFAFAFVPMIAGSPLGGIIFTYDQRREFEPTDRTFKAIVARQCAIALERVEAARAREEILAIVSHDLRVPLNAILVGAGALVEADLADRGHVCEVAGRIHRQADRMAHLIDDLVDVAAFQTGHIALVRGVHAASAIVGAATDMFGVIATERGVRLDTAVAADLPEVDCDPERTVQVLSNLLANALEVSSRGSAITIGARRDDPDVVFFVRDTGPGIDAATLPMLFEPFWRGKSTPYKGTGLGLSIARGIVLAHGGSIWAQSEVGVGSTFSFSLSTRGLTAAGRCSTIPDACPL